MSLISLRRAGALLFAGTLALAGCSSGDGASGKSCTVENNSDGSATIRCEDGTSTTVTDGNDGTPAGCSITPNSDGTKTISCSDGTRIVVRDAVVDFTKLTAADLADMDPNIVVTNVTIGADGKPVIGFKVSDRHGNGVSGLVQRASTARFAILKLAAAGAVNGSASETWVVYNANNQTSTSSYETPATSGAVLNDRGDGTYTFKFNKDITNATAAGTTYESSRIHRVALVVYQSGNPYRPMNTVFDFVPATGQVLNPDVQEVVNRDSCMKCHSHFRAKANSSAGFHGGSRYDPRVCVMCHNDQRRFTSLTGNNRGDAHIDPDGAWTGNLAIVNGEGWINFPVFIHKIHMGEHLTLDGGSYAGFQPYHVTYPQNIGNCTKCHNNTDGRAGRADNWKEQPSRRACGACHDDVSFAATVPNARRQHTGGAKADDTAAPSCRNCHPATSVVGYHLPVAPPNPDNSYVNTTSTGSANTNAAWVAATGLVPDGATQIDYLVDVVSTTATGNPKIKFKFQKKAPTDTAFTDVEFVASTAWTSTSEIVTDFIGSPSVYFAWAQPQDGIAAPVDFNATASGYVKNIVGRIAGTASTTTITGPTGGWYEITITNVVVPPTARHLTGGIGYSYSLSSTQPMTQTNVPGYPYTVSNKTGGLIVPVPNKWKVATGHTARRSIVETARCNSCHDGLGVSPTFHAGQRNDGPTCSFCHTPNRMHGGWAITAKEMVHAIHADAKRDVPFSYYASADHGFYDITYPGVLNDCEQCHVSNGYDYSSSAFTSETAPQLGDLLWSTAGSYGSAAYKYRVSPFLAAAVNGGNMDPNAISTSIFYSAETTAAQGLGYGFTTGNRTINDGRTVATSTLANPVTQRITTSIVDPAEIVTTSGSLSDDASRQRATDGTIRVCTAASPCTCSTNTPCWKYSATGFTCGSSGSAVCNRVCGVPGAGPTGDATLPCDTACTATPNQPCTQTCTNAAPCEAEAKTLVNSPITAACAACHTTATARAHFATFGGSFYEPRSVAFDRSEQCLTCHGPGKVAAIKEVHSRR